MTTLRDARAEAVPAGTVVVFDAQDGTVLLLRRRDSLRFMGGFWVFPGGAVDAEDVARAGGSEVAAAAEAACRELHEEAGLRLAAADLVHCAHWITPSAAMRRFDTHFFVGVRPPGQTAWLASAESSELCWVEPARVADAPAGFAVTAPTLVVLREVSLALREASAAGARAALARRGPVRTVLPKILDGAAVMPWDPEYGALPGEGLEWDAAGLAERADWPSRFPAVVPARPAPGQ
ncbi:MAG: NUDIX hydrolase [Steroidobacteraceae bacterium]|nr:NUDIX hydrolase [Steroidobacteraceae bacterium]